MNIPSIYDTENAEVTMVMYHKKKWHNTQYGQFTNRMTYFTKFADENEIYNENPIEVELGRLVNIVKSRITGDFKDNKIQTIMVYKNNKKGGKNPHATNQELFKVVFSPDGLIKDATVRFNDPYWTPFIKSIIIQIQEVTLNA